VCGLQLKTRGSIHVLIFSSLLNRWGARLYVQGDIVSWFCIYIAYITRTLLMKSILETHCALHNLWRCILSGLCPGTVSISQSHDWKQNAQYKYTLNWLLSTSSDCCTMWIKLRVPSTDGQLWKSISSGSHNIRVKSSCQTKQAWLAKQWEGILSCMSCCLWV